MFIVRSEYVYRLRGVSLLRAWSICIARGVHLLPAWSEFTGRVEYVYCACGICLLCTWSRFIAHVEYVYCTCGVRLFACVDYDYCEHRVWPTLLGDFWRKFKAIHLLVCLCRQRAELDRRITNSSPTCTKNRSKQMTKKESVWYSNHGETAEESHPQRTV